VIPHEYRRIREAQRQARLAAPSASSEPAPRTAPDAPAEPGLKLPKPAAWPLAS
jgi:hypothetical protein